MELRQYLSLAWKWLWLIVLGTVVAAGMAYLISKNMTPIYRASTLLLINEAPDPTVNDYSSILASQQLVQTYAERLTKISVYEEVMRRLNMPQWDVEVSVEPIRDTELLMLNVEHPDPELAARVANTIPEVFVEQNEQLQRARFESAKDRLSQQLDTLDSEMETIKAKMTGLQGSDKLADQADLQKLQDTMTEYQSSYQFVLRNYQNVRLAETQAINNLLVDQPAVVPERPVKPRTLLNTLLAAVVGAVLAVGIAFTAEYLDDTIKAPEDVRQALDTITLGAITRIEASDSNLVTVSHPRSPISEAYRGLRTNIQFSSLDQPPKTLLITSANPSEGKSTTVANLAVVIAQAGLSVIVVDSDLRRPALHDLFGVANGRGLTSVVLQSEPDLANWLVPTSVENVRLLTSGPLPPNPSELLGSQRMQTLIGQLAQQADLVLFDSPPLLAVTDAAVLASEVDGVLLIISAGETRRGTVQRAADTLGRVGATLLGAVLNKLSSPGRSGYYYDYYASAGESRRVRHDGQGLGEESPRHRPRTERGLVGAIRRWIAGAFSFRRA
jgi:succinoglycan biosynthesis transport protein ExoP